MSKNVTNLAITDICWGAAREETAMGALTLLLLVLWQDTENKDVLGKLSTSVLHSPKVASTATP